jgi:hypothetical protein
MIPEIPVPQGWEQVPAIGTGTGIQEMIKIAAAISPTNGLNAMSFFEIVLSLHIP